MKKIDEVTNRNSCFNRACDEEPIFVLLGRDVAAPGAIRQWVAMRVRTGKNLLNDPQIVEALHLADEMNDWFNKKKEPAPEGTGS